MHKPLHCGQAPIPTQMQTHDSTCTHKHSHTPTYIEILYLVSSLLSISLQGIPKWSSQLLPHWRQVSLRQRALGHLNTFSCTGISAATPHEGHLKSPGMPAKRITSSCCRSSNLANRSSGRALWSWPGGEEGEGGISLSRLWQRSCHTPCVGKKFRWQSS